MRAMVLAAAGQELIPRSIEVPRPAGSRLLVRVHACGVCRTDLHIVDGELSHPKLPLVPGHEIVGSVVECGPEVSRFKPGDRVGIPWLGWTCGACPYCIAGRENLCDLAKFTGYEIDGGYAEFTVADERYCFSIPATFGDVEAAPLLCAGLIGYRALRMAGDARTLGVYGFGAAAHIVAQIGKWLGRELYAFTSPGDVAAQKFALELGVHWAGPSDAAPPVELDAALIFAPVGPLVPRALRAVAKGGTVVCAGIHMSDIPAFPYKDLWGERAIRSVANLTRADAEEFLDIAPRASVFTHTTSFPLEDANRALALLRAGQLQGAAVLVP